MPFTVSSRGRPIGVTDLGFTRLPGLDRSRSGWFHPNAEGERLMPVIAAVLPALRACSRRDRAGEDGRPAPGARLRQTTPYADFAEALHHVGSLDLTLHREDGSLVPTEDIGLQDTEQLLALAAEHAAEHVEEWDEEDDPFEPDMLGDSLDEYPLIARELEAGDDPFAFDDPLDRSEPWRPRDEPTSLPRYQIFVTLAEGVELP